MSVGSLNGGDLSLRSLTIGGATFTGASGITGLTTTPATGTTTANPLPFSVGSVTTGSGATTLAFTATSGGMSLGGNINTSAGSGNVNATTATTGTPLVWSAGVYNPGQLVIDTSTSGNNAVYICSATTASTGPSATPPNTLVPSYWNLVVTPGGTGGGITGLSTTPATGTTTATDVPFSASITRNAGTDTAVFTATPTGMALALNVTPGTGGGITTLTGTGGTPTTATSIAFTTSITSSATTALSFVPSASGMELSGTIASSGGTGLPFFSNNKAWTTTGATDSITVTALPAGTYLPLVSFTDATSGNIQGVLSAPVPTAGSTTLQVLASGSIPAGTTYAYVLFKLT